MTRTAIAICTYRRPDGLARVLKSLDSLTSDPAADQNVVVIVVDNDPAGSAASTVAKWDESFRFPLTYVSEPRKGLANARNAALAQARASKADRLAFIDDDEMASPGWLEALNDSMDRTAAAIIAGPTYPLFQRPPDSWTPIRGYAYVPLLRQGAAQDASSANILIDLEKVNITFDPIFNESGGEDTHFVTRVMNAGERIGWAPAAIVWDAIPVTRMKTSWLLRRWFRTGVTEAKIDALKSGAAVGRIRNAWSGLIRVAYGSVRIAYGAVRAFPSAPYLLVANCYTFCRGLGYLVGALGRSFAEYSTSRYR